MSFIIYDIALLIAFALGIGIFLFAKKNNLKKEGLFILYKTSWGIKLINYVGTKYKKTLHVLSYISIVVGYFLMAGIVYMVGKIVWIYVMVPRVVEQLKVPPIMPLIPYIDKFVEGFPPFYFIYWIIILSIIAVTHEFAHGIFMKKNNIKIKSTGFGFFPFFLPVFLAAFVEQDEKSMKKSSSFSQMAVLSAGTFANIITAIVGFVVLILFFTTTFSASGVMFDTYSYSIVNTSDITMVNGVDVFTPDYNQVLELINASELNEIYANGILYRGVYQFSSDGAMVGLYDDLPAINNRINRPITKINYKDVLNLEELSLELSKYSFNETIVVTSLVDGVEKDYEIVLHKNPHNKDFGLLGIGFNDVTKSGISKYLYNILFSFKEPHVYYKSVWGEFGLFVYYFLFWIILVAFGVALMNMFPAGMFDGGRFFYLTIFELTKSEKIANKCYKLVTWLSLALLLVIMVAWAVRVF